MSIYSTYTVCVRSSSHPPRSHCQQRAAGSSHGAPPSQSATHCHSASALRTESPVLYLQIERAKFTHRCKLPVLSIQHSLPHRPAALTSHTHIQIQNWQDISTNSNISRESTQTHTDTHEHTYTFKRAHLHFTQPSAHTKHTYWHTPWGESWHVHMLFC